jgi:hypothetical protein
MERKFYLPTHSGSVAHYFNRAIILPSKYYTNKPDDIQNYFENSIILSLKKWSKNSDCVLEVVLTEIEINELEKVRDNLFLSKFPIPASRVKRIWFANRNQMETTIWNINNGAAFIPERLVEVDENFDLDACDEIEFDEKIELSSKDEFYDKVKYYDLVLGGLAFMRIGCESNTNYSFNYFSTLSFFNRLIEEQTIKASIEKEFKFSNKFVGLFSKNESEWFRWRKYIFQNIELHDIEALAEEEGVKIERKLGAIKIDSINVNSRLYELAILATYGNSKNKSADNLVSDLTSGVINSEKVEDVAILFGLNTGYSKLRNKYKGVKKESVVKFNLESKLDYYTIESVFQFVFNNNRNNYTFEYIDYWCPDNKKFETVKGYEVYRILDTTVIAKKKQTIFEVFLEKYSRDIYKSVIKSTTAWIPSFTKIDENEALSYFDKQLRDSMFTAIEGLQLKIEKNIADELLIKEQADIEILKSEIKNLNLGLTKSNEENLRLNKVISDLEALQNTRSSEHINNIVETQVDVESNQLKIYTNMGIVVPEVKIIDELKSEVSESDAEYGDLNISELKKIAREKKIKGYTKIDNAQELIKLIKKTPPTLL